MRLWREFFHMTQPWLREHTQEWVAQLEHRLEDIDYYLNRTVAWCEEHGITDDRAVMTCGFITCIWVSHMRCEPISLRELVEFLGLADIEPDQDQVYNLGPLMNKLDHEEILQLVAGRIEDF
jgi:hypothetical protein